MALIRLVWMAQCLAALAGPAQAVTLTVSTSGGNASSPYLYGIMFEVSTAARSALCIVAHPIGS